MSAIRPTPKSACDSGDGSLLTLVDGRRMTYEAVIEDAQRQRSQAIGMFIRTLFGFDKPTPVAIPTMPHQHRIAGHRHA